MLSKIINEILKNNGFDKKSNNWYFFGDEVIQVINLQKSKYGEKYYLNFGVSFKCLSDITSPKENQCHIRFRLSSMLNRDIDSILDMENISLSQAQREAEISNLLIDFALPIMSKCRKVKDVSKLIADGQLGGAMIRKELKEMIVNSI